MNNFKKNIKIANIIYINWIINPRNILFIILFLYFNDIIYNPLKDISCSIGYCINSLEPFILIMTKGLYASFPPLLFIMLMSDFPNEKYSSIFFIFRCSKNNWLQGQMIFSIYVSITIILFLLITSFISIGIETLFVNTWSDYTLLSETYDNDLYNNNQSLFINKNVYTQSYPYDALIKIISLFGLYTYLISVIFMFFKLIKKRIFGIIIICTFICASITTWITNSKYMWIFPMANSIFSWRYTTFLSKPSIPLWQSYLYFLIPIIVFSVLNRLLLKKYDFTYNDN